MEVTPRLVPWLDWGEWQAVYHSLFEANSNQQWGLDAIALWRLRGRLPHAIDITASLVEVIIQDSHRPRSEHELRMQYSIIIVRAVNGLVDPSQQSYFADSVMSLASKIDIPGWIVELRHDATHNVLPSLSILRSAANHMLQWLHRYYWSPQLVHLSSLTSLCVPHIQFKKVKKKGKKVIKEVVVPPSVSFDDCCPTLLLDLLLSQFLSTTLGVKVPTSSASLSTHSQLITKVVRKQKNNWLPVIKSACKFAPGFSICILMRIYLHLAEFILQIQAISYKNVKLGGKLKFDDEEDFTWSMKIGCFWINLISSEFNPVVTDTNFHIIARSVENQFLCVCKRINKELDAKNQKLLSPLIACMLRSPLMASCNIEKIIQNTMNIDYTSVVEKGDSTMNLNSDDIENDDDDDDDDADDDDGDEDSHDDGNESREEAQTVHVVDREEKEEGILSELEALESWLATKNGDAVQHVDETKSSRGKRRREDHHDADSSNNGDCDIAKEIDLDEEEIKFLDPQLQQAPTIWEDDKDQEWPLGLVPGSSILGSMQNPSLIFSLY